MKAKSAAAFGAAEIGCFNRDAVIAIARRQPVLFESRLREVTKQQGSIRYTIFPDKVVLMGADLI